MTTLLTNPKFATVTSHFEKCCQASREHSKLVAESLEEFGDHGTLISGVARDHFPEEVKDRLRNLARTISTESDLAYAARPKYVRLSTIRRIGQLVAKRDGSGFYGPRA